MKKIRIVSPAKQIDKVAVDFAVSFLEREGFRVELGKHALGQHHYFSGTEAERLSDFQAALDDASVDIILCSRGGYGCVQIIDQLDFTAFLANPKLIVGYSDITVFHNHIYSHYGLVSVHATAPLNFAKNSDEALSSLINVLKGDKNCYEIEPHELNQLGEVSATVVGGNLAILYSLLGTNSDTNYADKILFIEDIGEAIYAVDRMFYALKKAGKLADIQGLIVGGMTNMKDSEVPYGMTVEEVILKHMEPYNIPVCFNFPAGHIDDNRAVVIGKEALLEVTTNGVKFKQ